MFGLGFSLPDLAALTVANNSAPVDPPSIVQEDGFELLLEDGSQILLEA